MVMGSAIKILDALFMLRPTQFFPLWITFMCGVIVASEPGVFTLTQLPYTALFFFTLNSSVAFILNQIADRHSDALNQKLFLLSEGHLPLWFAWIVSIALTVVSLVWSYGFSIAFLSVMILITVFGILYSFAGFMSHPYLSILVNALGGGFSFAAGYLAIDPNLTIPVDDFIILSLPYAMAWGLISVLVAIPDIKGDKACRKRTFAVAYGITPSFHLAFVLTLSTLVFSVFDQNLYTWLTVGLAAAISLASYFWVYFKSKIDETTGVLPVKLAMIVLALSCCVYYPQFLGLLLLNFLLSKFYYKQRFSLDYPKMS